MISNIKRIAVAAALAVSVGSTPSKADPSVVIIGAAAGVALITGEALGTPQPDEKRDYLIVGGGWFDFVDRDNVAAEFRAEYRPPWQLWRFKPMVGMFGTTDGAIGGYLGGGYDLHITKNLVVNVNTAVAFYSAGGGKDLGSTVLLRSGVELGWRFEDASRLSVSFHHMSHGEVFGDKNPGTEKLAVTYAIPIENLGKLFGR